MDACLNSSLYMAAHSADEHTVDLTRRMKAMEEAAYKEFFGDYNKRICAYLLVVANGDARLVEDSVQLTFNRITKHIRVFNTETEFWGWISRLAKTAYIDCYRKESTWRRLLKRFQGEFSNEPELRDDAMDERIEALDQAIKELSESERVLIQLKYFDKRDYYSIGVELGLSAKAVESRVFRIRNKLRKSLQSKTERASHE